MPYTSLIVRDIVLLCFPPDDAVFADIARRLLMSASVAEPAVIETALRQRYPQAVVRGRDPLASFGSSAWYLYRDGRYSPFNEGTHWWLEPDTARIVIDDDGRYLDGNPAALQLLGVDLEHLLASPSGSFTVPTYQESVPWILQLLQDTGELHSTTRLRPLDGRPDVPIEFHVTRDGAGIGRHISAVRPVPPGVLDVDIPDAEATTAQAVTDAVRS